MNEELKREASIVTNDVFDGEHDADIELLRADNKLLYDKLCNAEEAVDKLSAENKWLQAEICDARKKIDRLNDTITSRDVEYSSMKTKVDFQDGMIEGLKFALRCDGVSGGEVR